MTEARCVAVKALTVMCRRADVRDRIVSFRRAGTGCALRRLSFFTYPPENKQVNMNKISQLELFTAGLYGFPMADSAHAITKKMGLLFSTSCSISVRFEIQ